MCHSQTKDSNNDDDSFERDEKSLVRQQWAAVALGQFVDTVNTSDENQDDSRRQESEEDLHLHLERLADRGSSVLVCEIKAHCDEEDEGEDLEAETG